MKDRNLPFTDKILYILQKSSNTVVPVQWKDLIFCRIEWWESEIVKSLGLSQDYLMSFNICTSSGIDILFADWELGTAMHQFKKKLHSLGFQNKLGRGRRIYTRTNVSLWRNPEFSYIRHNQSDKDYEIYKGGKYIGIMDMEIWNDLYLFKRRWKRRKHELN